MLVNIGPLPFAKAQQSSGRVTQYLRKKQLKLNVCSRKTKLIASRASNADTERSLRSLNHFATFVQQR
jgi:hypothetical protein